MKRDYAEAKEDPALRVHLQEVIDVGPKLGAFGLQQWVDQDSSVLKHVTASWWHKRIRFFPLVAMSAITLPPELWGNILDSIKLDHPEDLQACALVSRSMMLLAQPLHFEDVYLSSIPIHPRGSRRFIHRSVHADARSLRATLTAEPHGPQSHLAGLIRRIRVPFCMGAMTPLRGFVFPRLQEIEFYPCSDHPIIGAPHYVLFEIAERLIAMESMRSVVFQGKCWPAWSSSQRLRAMTCLLRPTTVHLDSLTVWCVDRLDGSRERAVLGPADPDASIPRTKLRTLGLFFSPLMGDYLTLPFCPFDLSQLVNLEIHQFTETIGKALKAGRLSIERLKCFAEDFPEGLDLRSFPRLTHLQVHVDDDQLDVLTNALSRIAGDNRVVTVDVDIFISGLNSLRDWDREVAPASVQRLDDILSSLDTMPALRKVNLNFDNLEFMEYETSNKEYSVKEGLIRAAFPKLEARGIVEVPVYCPGTIGLIVWMLDRSILGPE
ncbi:hypothetical protein C8R43DRAFT_642640 [Mycena crocata]|nr:hypothetical protein C8R43DRAFT_642640 [Mycena crocata]